VGPFELDADEAVFVSEVYRTFHYCKVKVNHMAMTINAERDDYHSTDLL
jgi:hypothetical protein